MAFARKLEGTARSPSFFHRRCAGLQSHCLSQLPPARPVGPSAGPKRPQAPRDQSGPNRCRGPISPDEMGLFDTSRAGPERPSEFYVDDLRPLNVETAVGVFMFRDQGRAFGLPLSCPAVDEDRIIPAGTLAPHLRQAFPHYRRATGAAGGAWRSTRPQTRSASPSSRWTPTGACALPTPPRQACCHAASRSARMRRGESSPATPSCGRPSTPPLSRPSTAAAPASGRCCLPTATTGRPPGSRSWSRLVVGPLFCRSLRGTARRAPRLRRSGSPRRPARLPPHPQRNPHRRRPCRGREPDRRRRRPGNHRRDGAHPTSRASPPRWR